MFYKFQYPDSNQVYDGLLNLMLGHHLKKFLSVEVDRIMTNGMATKSNVFKIPETSLTRMALNGMAKTPMATMYQSLMANPKT